MEELGLNLDGSSRIWDDWYDDWLKPGYSWKVLNLQTPQNPPNWFESSRSSLKFYWQYCWNVSTWATPAFSKSCQLLHQSLDTIVPRSYGKQQFGFTVNSVQNGLDVLEVFGWRLHAVYICMHLCHPLWRELATESAEDIPLFQGPELTCFLRRYISYKENPEENLEPDTAASLMCSTCSKWHVRAEHGSWSPGRTTSVTVTGRNGGSTLTSTRTFSTRSAGSCSEVVLAYCIINQWNNCESDGRTKMVKTHKKKTNRLTDLFLPACMSHMYRNCQSHDIKCLKISLVFVVTSPFLELHPLPDSHSCLQLRPRRIQLSSWGPDLTRRWPPPTYDLAELKICWAWPNDQVVNESLELERSPR